MLHSLVNNISKKTHLDLAYLQVISSQSVLVETLSAEQPILLWKLRDESELGFRFFLFYFFIFESCYIIMNDTGQIVALIP